MRSSTLAPDSRETFFSSHHPQSLIMLCTKLRNVVILLTHSGRLLWINFQLFAYQHNKFHGTEFYTLPTPLVQKVWTFIKTHRHFSVGCRLASTDQNMLTSHPTNGLFLFWSFCWLLFYFARVEWKVFSSCTDWITLLTKLLCSLARWLHAAKNVRDPLLCQSDNMLDMNLCINLDAIGYQKMKVKRRRMMFIVFAHIIEGILSIL